MSTLLMGLCWPLSMSPTCKCVLISLADQANDQGYCWPSMATLSERTCLSERAVRNAVRALEELGVLQVDVGAMKSNRYVLRVREYLRRLEAERPVESHGEAASPRHHVPPGTTCPPAPDAGHPARGAPHPGTSCPLTIIEPNTNTPQTPQAGPGGPETPSLKPDRRSTRGGEGAIEIGSWVARCREAGEKPIPPNDPIFEYCARVGLPTELLTLCWREFKRRQQAGKVRAKNWRQKFRNCVEAGWYGLWYFPPGEPVKLSSKGEQVQRYFAALDAEAAGELQAPATGSDDGQGGEGGDA